MDSRTDLHAIARAYMDAYSNADSHLYCHADVYPYAYAHTDSSTDCHACGNRHAYIITDSDTQRDTYADSCPDRHIDTYSASDSNTNAYSIAHAYAYSVADTCGAGLGHGTDDRTGAWKRRGNLRQSVCRHWLDIPRRR